MDQAEKVSVLWFGTGSMTKHLLAVADVNYLHIQAFIVDSEGVFISSDKKYGNIGTYHKNIAQI